MASAALTARQQEELHKAIHGYLVSNNFADAAAAFAAKAGLPTDAAAAAAAASDDALLKKWKSIVRLQKKVLDLEAQVTELQDAAKNGGVKKVDESDALPKSTPKFTLTGHRGAITEVAYHPSFSYLASASDDASVKLWDYETGKFQRSLNGHTDAVAALAFSPSGALLASAGADLNVKLWDMSSFECVKTLTGHDHTVSALAFTPASASQASAAASAASVLTGGSAAPAAPAPAGDVLYSASRDGTIKAWDPATGFCLRTFTEHDGWVRAIAVSPSGAVLASGGQDQTVRIWSTTTGECLHVFSDHEHVVECVAFSNAKTDAAIRRAYGLAAPASSRAAAIRERIAAARAAAAGGYANPVPASASTTSTASTAAAPSVGSAAIHPEAGGQFLFSAGRDRTVRIWDMATLQCVATLTVCENWVNSVLVHPSGNYLLAAADDKAVRVLDISKQCREVRKVALPAFAAAMSWNANPAMLAVGLADHNVALYECSTGGL